MRWYVRKIESITGDQWGQKNPNLRAHRSSGKRGLPSFSLNGRPEDWDFSHIPILHLVTYCIIVVRVPKVREKSVKNKKKFKVREKSGNFELSQGNLKFWEKSGNFITTACHIF